MLPQQSPQAFRDRELDRPAIKILIDRAVLVGRDGKNGIGIRANEHEACLTQREQPGKAVEQVHGHTHQGVDGPFLQDRNQHNGRGRLRQGIVQQEQEDIQRHQQQDGDQAAKLLFRGDSRF